MHISITTKLIPRQQIYKLWEL